LPDACCGDICMYDIRKILPSLVMVLYSQVGFAETCLDGFELTAIVVLENDIRQSVASYACHMVHPRHELTYELYDQLRQRWGRQRFKQRIIRDRVYRRIYSNEWRAKIDEWRRVIATNEGRLFKPEINACQDLRLEILKHIGSWKALFMDAARKAAGEAYDPLRCTVVEAK